jgi:transcriptional regulator with XRE-family HTH domain
MKANGRLARARRIEQGRSLSALARTLGCDKGQLSKVERGQEGMSESKLRRLAIELGLPMDELVPELAELKRSL